MFVQEDLPALVLRGVAVRARGVAGAAPGARRPLRRDGEGGEVGPPLRVRLRVFDGRHVQRGQVRAHGYFFYTVADQSNEIISRRGTRSI